MLIIIAEEESPYASSLAKRLLEMQKRLSNSEIAFFARH